MPFGWILLLVVVLVIGYIIFLFNKLIVLKNRTDNSWHQIDVQLKRRYDLIPNLVETVKGYAAHESKTFEMVTNARAQAIQAGNVKDQGGAENMLTGALKSLFAVAEAYPELKANENFKMLQEELAGTEGKIAYARQFYNDCVMRFNQQQEVVPSNIVASTLGFQKREYFEIDVPEHREPVKVEF